MFLWFSYGFPMVFLWFSYGFTIDQVTVTSRSASVLADCWLGTSGWHLWGDELFRGDHGQIRDGEHMAVSDQVMIPSSEIPVIIYISNYKFMNGSGSYS